MFRYLNGGTVGQTVMKADDIIDVTNLSLNKQETKVEKMNKNYIGEYDTIVRVNYNLGDTPTPDVSTSSQHKHYNFKTSITDLQPGDFVVVDAAQGLQIVRVQLVIERSMDSEAIREFNKAKAWVVCKIDDSIHNQRKAATERKEFILQQLAERKEQMEEIAIYKMLAETDGEAKKLIAELEKLS